MSLSDSSSESLKLKLPLPDNQFAQYSRYLLFMEELLREGFKKKNMEISIRGGGVKPVPHFPKGPPFGYFGKFFKIS